MQREVEAKRQKAYKKGRCGQCCYFTWWVVSLLYVLGIIFVIMGMAGCFGMPAAMGSLVNKKTTTMTYIIGNASTTIDTLVKNTFGSDIKPMAAIINGTDAEFDTAMSTIKTSLNSSSFLTTLLDSLDASLNQTVMGLSDVFKFTDATTAGNQQDGQTAINRLFTDLGDLNTQLGNIATMINAMSADAKTAMGANSIPANIPSQISDATIKSVVTLFTQAKPTFYQFMCKMSQTGVVAMANLAMITDLFFPYAATTDCTGTGELRTQANLNSLFNAR